MLRYEQDIAAAWKVITLTVAANTRCEAVSCQAMRCEDMRVLRTALDLGGDQVRVGAVVREVCHTASVRCHCGIGHIPCSPAAVPEWQQSKIIYQFMNIPWW